MSAQHSAFLSVRLPEATRDRLKAAAAARGESVQGLVGGLVERFLVQDGREPPSLAAVVAAVRSCGALLESRGVTGLWVFGSVARGEARADSDVDLFVEFAPNASVSLVSLASLRAELSEKLGAPADLVERGALKPAIRETAERDAVRVI